MWCPGAASRRLGNTSSTTPSSSTEHKTVGVESAINSGKCNGNGNVSDLVDSGKLANDEGPASKETDSNTSVSAGAGASATPRESTTTVVVKLSYCDVARLAREKAAENAVLAQALAAEATKESTSSNASTSSQPTGQQRPTGNSKCTSMLASACVLIPMLLF